MQSRSSLPSADRVGLLVASALLIFALNRLVHSPRLTFTVTLPGFYLAYPFTLGSGMTFLAAVLSGLGMRWLAGQDAPKRMRGAERLILPALTTFVLGSFLTLPQSWLIWWAALAFAGLLLAGVFTAEHITAEPSSPLYGFARASLTALAHALFLITAAALRFSGMRMFLLVPAIFLAAGLISLRVLHLDGTNRWDFPWAAGIGLISMQIAGGLHYWGITPLQFALALTGPFYGLTLLSTHLSENIPARRAALAPALFTGAAWVAAFFLG